MSAFESLVFAYLVNAFWQLPLLALAAALVLRSLGSPAPRLQYTLWCLVACLAALLPLSVTWGLYAPVEISSGDSNLPAEVSRLCVMAAILVSLFRAAKLARAWLAAFRLRQRTDLLFHHRGIRVHRSPKELEPAGPLLVGVWRPMILVPDFLTGPAHAELLAAALAHESAHADRRDMLTHTITELLLLPLAFHPMTHWLRSQLHISRELACDAQSQVDPVEYARCLLLIARQTLQPDRHLTALGIGGTLLLERRIHALAAPGTGTLTATQRRWAVLLLVFACLGLAAIASGIYQGLSSVPAPNAVRKILVGPPPPPPPPPPGRSLR